MKFKETKGIFQQIADNICEKVLSGELPPGSKVPSVREQAAAMGVNPNTIMRTYTELQRDNIISNQRGIGYFITVEAPEEILKLRKKEFFHHYLPEFIHQLKLINPSRKELKSLFDHLNSLP